MMPNCTALTRRSGADEYENLSMFPVAHLPYPLPITAPALVRSSTHYACPSHIVSCESI